jgi:hypothetical protein
MAGCREHRNEPSDSINGGEFLQQLSDYQLLKKDSATRSYLKGSNGAEYGMKAEQDMPLRSHVSSSADCRRGVEATPSARSGRPLPMRIFLAKSYATVHKKRINLNMTLRVTVAAQALL